MIINAAINEELALGVLKEHLPKKRELFFWALEFFYLNFLPTTINICMFFAIIIIIIITIISTIIATLFRHTCKNVIFDIQKS